MNTYHATIADTAAEAGPGPDSPARAYPGPLRDLSARRISGVRGAGEYCRQADLYQEQEWPVSAGITMQEPYPIHGMCHVTIS
nr:hypothetical protein [uncultured Methanoregula sp.]